MSALADEFSEQMARVIKLVTTQRTLPTQLEAVVALAKRAIATCDAAGVTLVIVGKPTTPAATDRIVFEVDLVQYGTGQGPCLDAIAQSNVVRVDLIGKETRYSRFAPGAMDSGIISIVSFPLLAAGRTVGALNLYSSRAEAFDDATEEAMAPLVSYASDVLATSPLYANSLDLVDGLVEAVDDRAVIDQASGLLMAENQLTSGDAFSVLRDRALVQHVSLREAADSVLEAHNHAASLDERPEPRG